MKNRSTQDCNFKHFESWEEPYWLNQKEDWHGLVKYYEAMFSRYPDDDDSQYYLGDAYVLNKEYKKAIQFIEPYYRAWPDNSNFHNIILDSLFALGKNENDFDWIEKPVVLRLSKAVLDTCFNILKTRREKEPLNVAGLHIELMNSYLLFKEEELHKALKKDERFSVDDSEGIYFAEVKLACKK